MCLRKKTQNLSTSCTSCRLNPHDQLGRLCVYGIYKRSFRAPTKENTLVLIAVDIGDKTQRRTTRLESESPHNRSRDQHSVGGHPREVRWTVTPSEGKDSLTAVTQEKHLLLLCFDLFYRFFCFFFFSALLPPLCCPVQFSCSVVSDSLRPHDLEHARPLHQLPEFTQTHIY